MDKIFKVFCKVFFYKLLTKLSLYSQCWIYHNSQLSFFARNPSIVLPELSGLDGHRSVRWVPEKADSPRDAE